MLVCVREETRQSRQKARRPRLPVPPITCRSSPGSRRGHTPTWAALRTGPAFSPGSRVTSGPTALCGSTARRFLVAGRLRAGGRRLAEHGERQCTLQRRLLVHRRLHVVPGPGRHADGKHLWQVVLPHTRRRSIARQRRAGRGDSGNTTTWRLGGSSLHFGVHARARCVVYGPPPLPQQPYAYTGWVDSGQARRVLQPTSWACYLAGIRGGFSSSNTLVTIFPQDGFWNLSGKAGETPNGAKVGCTR